MYFDLASPETEIYFDESSSSRDGFDLLQSPTLLPMTHPLQYDTGDTGCIADFIKL